MLWFTPLHNFIARKETRQQCQHIPDQVASVPTAFPILSIQLHVLVKTSIITRTQFPLLPACATTTYKCQSRSMRRIIAHVEFDVQDANNTIQKQTITSNHLYIQCSRLSHGTDLMLFPYLPNLEKLIINVI